MITGNEFCLIVVASYVQRELHRAFRTKLITRAVLKKCRTKHKHIYTNTT